MKLTQLLADARRGLLTAMLAGLLLLGGSAAVVLAQSPDASSTPTPTTQSDGGSQDQPDSTQDVELDCPLKDGAEAS